MVKETLTSLRKIAKGTDIKITKIRGTDNVLISGGGFKRIYKQLNTYGGNLSATSIIRARKKIIKIRIRR